MPNVIINKTPKTIKERILIWLVVTILASSIGGLMLMLIWNFAFVSMFAALPTLSFMQSVVIYALLKILF